MKTQVLLIFAMEAIAAVALRAANPAPLVYEPLQPASVAPGGSGFTLTVEGTEFVSGAVVEWNGAALPTTFISATKLTASVSSSDIATPQTAAVTVVNPTPRRRHVQYSLFPSPTFPDDSDVRAGASHAAGKSASPFSRNWRLQWRWNSRLSTISRPHE